MDYAQNEKQIFKAEIIIKKKQQIISFHKRFILSKYHVLAEL